MFGKLLEYRITGQDVALRFENGGGKVQVVTDTILRVYSGDEKQRSKALAGNVVQTVPFRVEMENGTVLVRTDAVTAKVSEDFKVDFFHADGTAVCRDYRGERVLRDTSGGSEQAFAAQEGHAPAGPDFRHRIEILKEMGGDECFYGLGDMTGYLNKRHYAYALWNTDNPNPQVDSFKSMYKSIPFFITLTEKTVYGIFFDNPYKTYFDFGKESENYFFFGTDGGNLDYYYIAGTSMAGVAAGYTYLTGSTPVPQEWVLGYHQSRWSYKSRAEVEEIARRMRELNIPCDAVHLDIDYMDHFKVFTFDEEAFPHPKQMMDELAKDGFKIVTIIDPGVKAEPGYPVYDEGMQNGYFAENPDGSVYVNAVWPGDAVFPDFGNPKAREWWAGLQKYLVELGVRGVWNDMNEPASFHGELPQNVVFTDEDHAADHARMHNVFGLLMSKATYDGLKKHDGRRPFVITRACYAGGQKYTTTWTGDNQSIWAHLQMAIPQLCNLSLSGISFSGTDIGGFGSDATPELLTRWVQTGCFSPLFRNHSEISCIRQEPWCFGEKILKIYRKYVQLRYRLIPYYYDLFFEGEKNGMPVLRPLVFQYQNDPNVWNLNDEFLVGSSLLVAPVVQQGAEQKLVYLPDGEWFDYWTGEKVEGGRHFIRQATLDTCPIYVKAGGILPNWPVQDYVGQTQIRELTLDVYEGTGTYSHYQDDGESYAYRAGAYNEYAFRLSPKNRFTAELVHSGYGQVYESFRIRFRGKEMQVPFIGGRIDVELD